MILSARQQVAVVLACLTFGTFIAYRTAQWKSWTDEVRTNDAYESGPRNKSEMDFIHNFYAPKKKAVAHHHHRRFRTSIHP